MIARSWACYGGVSTRVLSVSGSGIPIVLLHGFADTADTWRAVLDRLAARGHRAVAVDLPGFGAAGRRRPGPLLPQFDDFTDALLDDLGTSILVGNSLGAATAVRAASRRGDLVKALVTLNDPISARHWLARLARFRAVPPLWWAGVGQLKVPRAALAWSTRHAARRVLYGPGVAPDPQVLEQWVRTASQWSDVATLGRYAFQYAYETVDGHRDLTVTCPTAVVHGARDRIIPVQSSRVLHEQLPSSELVILPRSGHCPQLDNPAEVVRLVLRLADGLS
jgi:pimeloyl-ACP methyl ester carboxylesterase